MSVTFPALVAHDMGTPLVFSSKERMEEAYTSMLSHYKGQETKRNYSPCFIVGVFIPPAARSRTARNSGEKYTYYKVYRHENMHHKRWEIRFSPCAWREAYGLLNECYPKGSPFL